MHPWAFGQHHRPEDKGSRIEWDKDLTPGRLFLPLTGKEQSSELEGNPCWMVGSQECDWDNLDFDQDTQKMDKER